MTEIGRDGTLEGPAFGQLAAVLEASAHPAGRERRGRHARRPPRAGPLRCRRPRRSPGIIVGRAIYEGRFGVAEALASLEEAVAD